jgi:hypothetical protein
MNLPRHLISQDGDPTEQQRAWRLENILKNVCIRRLTEIRVLKAKPSLKDMINDYMAKKGAKDQRQRLRIKEQVLQIYEQ